MKNALVTVLSGMLLFAGAAFPAAADDFTTPASDSNTIMLRNDECLKGTFQGYHMGQILMRTDDGLDVELPSMALFWGTEPRIQQADLRVGQALVVTLPHHTMLHVYNNDIQNRTQLGSYDGIVRVPQQVVSSWSREDLEAATR